MKMEQGLQPSKLTMHILSNWNLQNVEK